MQNFKYLVELFTGETVSRKRRKWREFYIQVWSPYIQKQHDPAYGTKLGVKIGGGLQEWATPFRSMKNIFVFATVAAV